jgi:hypothetical protein
VNALLGDAAVRFIGDAINIDVWRALSTSDGHEIVDANY